jgi:predicted transporter
MHFAHALSQVNWIAVLIAAIAAFLLGGIWYSHSLFGKRWLQEIGLTPETVDKAHMTKTFVVTFVLQVIAAFALAMILGSDSSWLNGLHLGLLVGLCWVATAYGITYLFEQRSLCIFMINAGYYIVSYIIMGTIIGAWPTTSV